MACRPAENQIWKQFLMLQLLSALNKVKCHISPPYFVPCQGPHPRIGPVEGLPVLQTQGELNVCGLIAVNPEQYFVLSPPFHLTLCLTWTACHCQDWQIQPDTRAGVCCHLRKCLINVLQSIHSFIMVKSKSSLVSSTAFYNLLIL